MFAVSIPDIQRLWTVGKTRFTLGQLSTWDYFHPNAAGQQVLASVSYAAGFR